MRALRLSRKCLFLGPPDEDNKLNDTQRRKALKNFVLTLSDQQLVTGNAILLACFANWCRTSIYELTVVVSLAWFSLAIHLATLIVLQEYFQQNRVVRNWRMIGTVSIVLLLIVGLLLVGYSAESGPSAPLQCLKYLEPAPNWEANRKMYCVNSTSYINATTSHISVYNDHRPGHQSCAPSYATLTFIHLASPAFTIAYLLYGYASGMLRTVIILKKTTLTLSHMLAYIELKMSPSMSSKVTMQIINNALIESRAKHRKTSERLWAKLSGRLLKKPADQRTFHLHPILVAYSGSFLYHIGGFCFGLSYGISQVASYGWSTNRPELQSQANRVDFGQIVPLVLLVLPLLGRCRDLPWYEILRHCRLVLLTSSSESDNTTSEEAPSPNMFPGASARIDPGPFADHLHLATVSDRNGQDRPSIPALSDCTGTSSSSNSSQRLTEIHPTTLESINDSTVQPSAPIGKIFLSHVTISIAVGTSLNLKIAAALVAGPLIWLSVALYVLLPTCMVDNVSTIRAIRRAARNNKFDQYKDNIAHEATELHTVTHGHVSTNITGASPSGGDAANDRQEVVETSSAPPKARNNQDSGQQNPSHNPAAIQTRVHEQGSKYDTDDDNGHIYTSPTRQDTESGLRGLCFSHNTSQ